MKWLLLTTSRHVTAHLVATNYHFSDSMQGCESLKEL